MRIVHISTADLAGGAARAAFGLHKALLALGEESTMLVRNKLSNLESVHCLAPEEDPRSIFGGLIETWYIHRNRTPISNTHFSLGWPGQDLSAHSLVREADIIHLHWVSHFQSPAALARLQGLGKPLVWSLHDQRPFTGGCHFSAGCSKYETTCDACPQLAVDPAGLTSANLADQRLLASSGTLTVVAPSHWLAGTARQSAVFSHARIEVIPNGIETDCFHPRPRPEARQKLGLPQQSLLLLFGAYCGLEKRKGFEQLVAALKVCLQDAAFRQLLEREELGFICFGEPAPTLGDLQAPIRSFGQIDSNELLSALYAAADLFVLPSLEDNLPNTVLESLSCGTPVAAFHTGGVPDLVIEGVTGALAPVGDHRQLAQSLLSLVSDPKRLEAMRPACRRQVEQNFSLNCQAESFRQLYLELLRPPLRALAPNASVSPGTAWQFERIFPALVQHSARGLGTTKARHDHPVPGTEIRWRRWWFLRRVRQAAKAAASGHLSHAALLEQLGEEVALCQVPLPQRTGRYLKRLLSSTP